MPPGRSRSLDPARYRRWFETSLGAQVDADEKQAVFALAGLTRGDRVLDLGCGDGNYTGPIADTTGRAVGVDSSWSMLKAARRRLAGRSDLGWVGGDGGSLPFRSEAFDAVIAVTVLCLAAEPRRVLDEAYRVLRPGGRLVVGELGRYSLWALWRRLRGLVAETVYREAHFFTPAEIRSMLEASGFRDVRVDSAVYYPPVDVKALIRATRPVEALGRRLAPWAGAFLVARGTRS